MARTPKEYQRLPGRGYRFKGIRFLFGKRQTSRLYLGSDHVLLAEQSWWVEDYRRFYFKDIQAVRIQRTNRRMILNIVYLTLMALFWVWGMNVSLESGGLALRLIAGSLGVASLISTLMGPTCVTHLTTAVQTVDLPSLCRARRAEKVMGLLRERILQAQGELPQAATEAAPIPVAPSLAAAIAAFPPGLAVPILKPYKGNTHRWMFCLLALDGALDGLQITLRSLPLMCVSSAVWIAAFGFLVAALVRQHQTDLRLAVRRLAWSVAVYLSVSVVLGEIIGVILSVESRPSGGAATQMDLLRQLAKINPLETPWLLSYLVFGVLGSFGLGLAGLLLLRGRAAQTPASEGAPSAAAPGSEAEAPSPRPETGSPKAGPEEPLP